MVLTSWVVFGDHVFGFGFDDIFDRKSACNTISNGRNTLAGRKMVADDSP